MGRSGGHRGHPGWGVLGGRGRGPWARSDRSPEFVKRLIVNADDFGRSAGVDRGIIRAHREGIVTSTTFMANAPGAEMAAALARATPTLDVGVHLLLSYARPLTHPATVPSPGRAARTLG